MDDDEDADEEAPNQPVPVSNDSVVLNMEIDTDGHFRVEGGMYAINCHKRFVLVHYFLGVVPVQNNQATPEAAPAQQAAGQAAAVNPDAEWQRLVAALRAPEMQRIIRTALNFGPFLFILLTKWMLTYAAGMFMVLMNS